MNADSLRTSLAAAASTWVARHGLLAWLGALALAVIVAVGGNLARGLLETTEGRYARCAQEMIERGDFLEPTLDGRPHWTKPPLAYWVLAAGMMAVGRAEEGARMAQAVVFLALLAAVALAARAMGDGVFAWWAVVVTATGLLPVLGVTFLSTDLLLTLWETLAMAAYLRSLVASRPRPWLALMGLGWGLAFLTKGPPGLLPLLALIPWHLWCQRGRPLVTGPGVALFAVAGLGWYAVEALRHPELVSYWLGQEVVARLGSDAFHRNPEPWKPFAIYVPLLAAGVAPWLVAARCSPRQLWAAVPSPWRALIGVWVLVPLVVFFVAKSRLPLYVLPLAIPLALAVAWALRQEAVPLGRVLVVALAVAGVAVVGRLVLAYAPLAANMRPLFQQVVRFRPREVVVFRERELFGLQAYLAEAGIALRRVGGEDEGGGVAHLTAEAGPGTVVVVREKRAAAVLEALGVAPDAPERVGHWATWVVARP